MILFNVKNHISRILDRNKSLYYKLSGLLVFSVFLLILARVGLIIYAVHYSEMETLYRFDPFLHYALTVGKYKMEMILAFLCMLIFLTYMYKSIWYNTSTYGTRKNDMIVDIVLNNFDDIVESNAQLWREQYDFNQNGQAKRSLTNLARSLINLSSFWSPEINNLLGRSNRTLIMSRKLTWWPKITHQARVRAWVIHCVMEMVYAIAWTCVGMF